MGERSSVSMFKTVDSKVDSSNVPAAALRVRNEESDL